MGTRCLTTFVDERGKEICVMYRQFDGYLDGHGKELAKFLKDFNLVNGFTPEDEKRRTANGIGCLAAQIVAHFKEGIGNIYLYPSDTRNVWESYVYEVSNKEGRPWIKAFSDRLLLEGYPEDFLNGIKNVQED